MTIRTEHTRREDKPGGLRLAAAWTLLALFMALVVAAPSVHAATYDIPLSSAGTLHNDYWRGNWWSWQTSTAGAGISSLDCFGGCFWSGDKMYFEMALPALAGNIVSATFYVDVTGGTGDAWFNAIGVADLTGDANADQNKFPWSFANSGARIQVGQDWTGWAVEDATAGVQAQYAAGLAFGTFTLDPVPWSTSLTINAANTHLVIATDAGSDAPEPGTLPLTALAGGLALAAAAARRKLARRSEV